MKFESYQATPGLARVPVEERFRVFRKVHRQLMREDPAYRTRFYKYVLGILALCASAAAAHSGTVSGILLPFVTAVPILYLAFRQQQYMNERVGEILTRTKH